MVCHHFFIQIERFDLNGLSCILCVFAFGHKFSTRNKMQGHAVFAFGVGGARFGVLTGEAANANDGLLGTLDEHKAHLQQDLQLARDRVGFAIGETLRAITALEQEALATCRLGQLTFQGCDFPACDQGRQVRRLQRGLSLGRKT